MSNCKNSPCDFSLQRKGRFSFFQIFILYSFSLDKPMASKLQNANTRKTAEQMKAEYREVISLLRKGYSIKNVAKLSGKGVSTIQRVKRYLEL